MRFELASTSNHQTDHQDSAAAAGLPGLSRPKVKFGLRMAVLAGVIAATSGTTTSLASPVNSLAGPADTTCCLTAQTSISTTA
jgi:hypothetical protein